MDELLSRYARAPVYILGSIFCGLFTYMYILKKSMVYNERGKKLRFGRQDLENMNGRLHCGKQDIEYHEVYKAAGLVYSLNLYTLLSVMSWYTQAMDAFGWKLIICFETSIMIIRSGFQNV